MRPDEEEPKKNDVSFAGEAIALTIAACIVVVLIALTIKAIRWIIGF